MSSNLAKQAGNALIWKGIQRAGANIIFLVRLLILARILLPEDFGLLAIAMTAIGFLSKITDFGMLPALVQHSQVTDQHYNTAWSVGVVRAMTITGVVILASPLIAEIFAQPHAADIIRVLAVLPLIEAVASIKVADLHRKLQFRSLAIAKLLDALTNTFVAIALAPSIGVWALVAGTLSGPLVYMVMSYVLAPHRPRLSIDLDAARPLIRYGRWIFLTSLIAISGSAVLRVIISRQLGAAELGLYFLAAKLAFFPAGVTNEIVGDVAFPVYARLKAEIGEAARAFRTMFSGMLVVLTPVCVLMIVLAPSLISNVLGPRWAGTLPLIRLLAVVCVIGVVADAAVPVLKGLGQPHKYAALEGVQTLFLIIFAWIFTKHFGLTGAALAWIPAIIGSLIASILFLQQTLPRPFKEIGSSLIAITFASGSGACLAIYIDNIFNGFLGFTLAACSAAIVTAFLLRVLDRRFNIGLTTDFAKAFPQAAAFLRL